MYLSLKLYVAPMIFRYMEVNYVVQFLYPIVMHLCQFYRLQLYSTVPLKCNVALARTISRVAITLIVRCVGNPLLLASTRDYKFASDLPSG